MSLQFDDIIRRIKLCRSIRKQRARASVILYNKDFIRNIKGIKIDVEE